MTTNTLIIYFVKENFEIHQFTRLKELARSKTTRSIYDRQQKKFCHTLSQQLRDDGLTVALCRRMDQ